MLLGFLPAGQMLSQNPGEAIEALCEIGYGAVELPRGWYDPECADDSVRRTITQRAGALSMALPSGIVQIDFIRDTKAARTAQIEKAALCLKTLGDMGVPSANFFTGPAPWNNPLKIGVNLSESEAWEMVFEAYDALLPVASLAGVRVAVENVWGMLCHDYLTLAPLLARYGKEISVNFDPSHDALAGHTDIAGVIKGYGDRISHVHLKDAAGIQRAGSFVFPILGDGQVNWKSFFAALREIGYQGACTVEFEADQYLNNILGGDIYAAAQLSLRNAKILAGEA